MSNFNWKYSILPVLLMAMMVLGCKKPSEFDLSAVAPELIGDWEWDRTYFYGFNEPAITNLESNYSMFISEDGRIELKQDNLVIDRAFITDLSDMKKGLIDDGFNTDYYVFQINSGSSEYGPGAIVFKYLIDEDELVTTFYPYETEVTDANITIHGENVYQRK